MKKEQLEDAVLDDAVAVHAAGVHDNGARGSETKIDAREHNRTFPSVQQVVLTRPATDTSRRSALSPTLEYATDRYRLVTPRFCS